MSKTYHIGIYRKNRNTLCLQASETLDGLSCELLKYYGRRITTKAHLKKHRRTFLNALRQDQRFIGYKYIQVI